MNARASEIPFSELLFKGSANKIAVVGIKRRSTTAVSKSMVNGMPMTAYSMQNNFPEVESGD